MGAKTTTREIDRSASPACLRAVLMHLPGSHPCWSNYLVSVCHLRVGEGLPPAKLHFPEASHEIAIFSLDPEHEPDPTKAKELRPLEPADLIHQLPGLTDDQAREIFDAFVDDLAARRISPDSDYRRWNALSLDAAVARARGAL